MCNRGKPYSPAEIEDMKVEMFNRQQSLERIVRKFEVAGWLSQDDRELANEHTVWINSHKDVIRNYYKPAMALA